MLSDEFYTVWNLHAGALLSVIVDDISEGQALDDTLSHGITVDYFYNGKHQILWEAIMDLHKKEEPINYISVTEKVLKKIQAYEINELLGVEAGALWQQYINGLKEHYRMHTIHRMGQQITENIESGVYESDDLIAEINTSLQALDHSEKSMMPASDFIMKGYEYLTKPKAHMGITTGFPEMDETIRGLRKAKVIIIAARPSLGKSSLALNIADAAADASDEAVVMFSLEMDDDELGARMICSRSRVNEDRIREWSNKKEIMGKVNAAANELIEKKIFVDDSADITMNQIQARSRKIKNKHGLGLIIIDYIQLVTPERTSERQNREQQVAGIARAMKKLAKNLQVPVLCLAQINREVEKQGREPRLSDLRESGAIEQDADIVMLLHQDEEMKTDEHVLAIIAKHRQGPTGKIDMTFKKYITRFENWDGRGTSRKESHGQDSHKKKTTKGSVMDQEKEQHEQEEIAGLDSKTKKPPNEPNVTVVPHEPRPEFGE